MSKIAPCVVGIDVSKATLDVAIAPRADGTGRCRHLQFCNDAAGQAALVEGVLAAGARRVALEATGGLERAVVLRLHAAGLAVVRLNPRQARDAARGRGWLTKTDRVDAALLARLAGEPDRRPVAPPDAELQRLQALVARRRQLVEMRKQERQRLSACALAEIAAGIRDTIELLGRQIEDLQRRIDAAIADSHELDRKRRLLCTAPGVAATSAAVLLAELPELGRLGGRQAASLLGVAPHACDSGKRRGRRTCYGGRRDTRHSLYMAAETARRKGAFKLFYDRLRANGKSHKQAVIAVLRKLLVTLNAMLTRNRPYIEKHSC